MEYELSRFCDAKLAKSSFKEFDLDNDDEDTAPTSTVTDDTCLNEIEDGLTETARTQIRRI